MKSCLIAVACALVVLITSCKKNGADTGTERCPVGDSIRANYSESALYMMMDRYLKDHSLAGYNSPSLSASERDNILGCLQAVYDMNSAESDTVFSLYRIRPFPDVDLYGVILQVDANAPEINRLLSTGRSGNSGFDQLLIKYGIDSIQAFSAYPYFNYVYAMASKPHNMVQVAKELDDVSFVYMAEANPYGGDGDDLTATYHPGYVELDYSIGRGDCPSGCMYRRHWVFRVSNCNATFISSYEKP